jgi:hypothetical protein
MEDMEDEADSVTTPDGVRKKLDELRKQQEEMSRLYDELQRSNTIQEIFPDAFEHGQCKATWVDAPSRDTRNRVRASGRMTVNFKVTRGDGSVREMPFWDLPEQFIDDLIEEKEIYGREEVDFKRNGRSSLIKLLSRIVRARKGVAYSEKRDGE